MKIIDLNGAQKHIMTQFNSEGVEILPLVRHQGALFTVAIFLEPGGIIGRHSAVDNQLFIVVKGDGMVVGKEEVPVPIVTGQAALWGAGEFHETRAGEQGMMAIVLEGDGVELEKWS